MIKWTFPLACALVLTACGTAYDTSSTTGASGTMGTTGTMEREAGSISSAPHVDPDQPAAGATTGGSVTDVTGEGAASPAVSGQSGTESTTGAGTDVTGTSGTSSNPAGDVSSAPHIDAENPGAGATTGDSVTDVTGEGAASPAATPESGTTGSSDTTVTPTR